MLAPTHTVISFMFVRPQRGHDLNLYCEELRFLSLERCRQAEMVTDHDTQSVTLRHNAPK